MIRSFPSLFFSKTARTIFLGYFAHVVDVFVHVAVVDLLGTIKHGDIMLGGNHAATDQHPVLGGGGSRYTHSHRAICTPTGITSGHLSPNGSCATVLLLLLLFFFFFVLFCTLSHSCNLSVYVASVKILSATKVVSYNVRSISPSNLLSPLFCFHTAHRWLSWLTPA